MKAMKAPIEAMLCWSGVPALARRLRRADAVILAYHNVIPDGEPPGGDRSLHLPRTAFAQQLDVLCRTHDVVPLSEVLEGEPSSRRRAVVTFDDAYRGALTVGLAELAARGLPATVFVAPARVGDRAFWWDALAGQDGLAPELRERALASLAGEDARIRAWAGAQGHTATEVSAARRCATEVELKRAAAQPGITFGSHSWSHANLTRLEQTELELELTRPLAWLRQRYGSITIPWIAYPYGLVSSGVQEAAARAGYRGGLCVSGGALRAGARAKPLALPRLSVPAGVSVRGFSLRLAGVLVS